VRNLSETQAVDQTGGRTSAGRDTPVDLPILGPATGFFRHWSNTRAAARLIDDLSDEGSRLLAPPEPRMGEGGPADDAARRAWQESVRTRLQTFGAERLGWPEGYRRLMFGDAFFTAAGDFSRAAHVTGEEERLDLLRRNCRSLVVGSIAGQPALFTARFRREVTRHWPLSLGGMRRLRLRARRRLPSERVIALLAPASP
jgi:hypothetical protein